MFLCLLYILFTFLDIVVGVTTCWTDDIVPTSVTELVDLRTPTAFTYLDGITIYNCSTNTSLLGPPTFYTTYYVAYLDDTPFSAQNSVVGTYTITSDTTFYEAYTFSGLTVTSLTPGESIVMRWTLLPPISGRDTGNYTIYVPIDAINPTSTTSSGTTETTASPGPTPSTGTAIPTTTPVTTPTTAQSSSSSVNSGAIAGGAIGGVIVLGAIFAFAWYKIRTKPITGPPSLDQSKREIGQGNVEERNIGRFEQEREGIRPTSTNLRYPEVGETADLPSGRISRVDF